MISAIVPMSNGRILVGGDTLARVFEDGTQDLAFQVHSFSLVQRICLQGEKILVLDGSGHLQRLNSDGGSDSTFRVPVLNVYSR